ncbi:WGxxGxxG family protein [Paenibacillus graminis]|uniref:WGxxGxxG family protein n=1 Tax=Paenibacillus graminis TaxID=189425 RepID=UPI000472313E|nr:WGxxGxxG family protein [Paenibacillus graminis]
MNKLITSFACGTVLSMSLLGVGYASTASGTTGMDGTGNRMMNEQGNTMMNNTTGTGTTGTTGTMRNRGGDNSTVSPLSNTTQTGRYRANATTANANDNDNDFDWGWLGLVGLLGLAGMRNKSGERERR